MGTVAYRQCVQRPVANSYDLSWHPHARHIREDELGLTPTRLRGIAEAEGDLLVFIDDDNILTPDYLERAAAIPWPIRILAFSAQAPWNQNLRRSRSQRCGRGCVCLRCAPCHGQHGPTMWRIISVRLWGWSVRSATVRRALFSICARIADIQGAGSAWTKFILRWRRPLFVAVCRERYGVRDLSGIANHAFDSGRTRAARLPRTTCARTQLLTCSASLHGLRDTPTSCNALQRLRMIAHGLKNGQAVNSTVVNCGCVYTTIQTTLYTTKMRNAATAPKRRTVRLVLGASSAALLPNARAKLKFLIAMKDGPLFVGKSCCTIPSAIPPEVTGRAASFFNDGYNLKERGYPDRL